MVILWLSYGYPMVMVATPPVPLLKGERILVERKEGEKREDDDSRT